MPHYVKVCPICFSQFYATRMSQTYCKKQCANKARSIPAKLLQAMIDKAAKGLQVVPIVPKVVRDFIYNNKDLIMNIHGDDISKIPQDSKLSQDLNAAGISLVDQKALIEQATALKAQRRKEELEKELATVELPLPKGIRRIGTSSDNNIPKDPEMEDFKL